MDYVVLPTRFDFVAISCVTLGKWFTSMTFGAEQQMSRVLDVKGATGGLNTDRLGQRNAHYWLAPLDIPDNQRDCVGVAMDRRLSPIASTNVRIPLLDANQAVMVGERFTRLEPK